MKNKRRFNYGCACILAALILAGCEQTEPQPTPPAIPVRAVIMAPASLHLSDDLPGRVAAVRVAEIRPQVSGIVLRRLFEQGTEVRAGQVLFQINPAPFKAEVDSAAAAVLRAEAALARAHMQANRLQPLVESDAVSRQMYDDAVSQRDQAAADVAQARAALARRQLDLKFASVEAPISGRIDQTFVTEGALVSGTDSNPMARIQQIDQVYIDVRQPVSSLESLRQALAAAPAAADRGLPVKVLRDNGETYDVNGRILFSGMNVDAGTGDVLLRVLADNSKRQLLPGMFVRARIPRASYADALTVPQQAVVRAGEKSQVWTIDTSNHVHLNSVELGELSNRQYRIRSGLHAGQRVVVEGMERLTDGATVAIHEMASPQPASDAAAH